MVSANRLRALADDARKNGEQSLLFQNGKMEDFDIARVCELSGQGDKLCCRLIDDVARWFAWAWAI